MANIKIRDLTAVTPAQVVAANLVASALDASLPGDPVTRKCTFSDVVSGGSGVLSNIFVHKGGGAGDNQNIGGNLYISHNAVISGNATIGGDLTVSGDVFHTGGCITSPCGHFTEALTISGNPVRTGVPGGGTGPVGGAGTANFVPKWTDVDTLGNSNIYNVGGYVGIGTTDPQARLHISGGDLYLHDLDGDATNNLDICYEGIQGRATFGAKSDVGNTTLSFGTCSGGTFSRKMWITSGGYVGIGTSDPSGTLHIHDTGDYPLIILSNDGPPPGEGGGGIRFSDETYNNPGVAEIFSNYGNIDLAFKITGDTKMLINADGNVGIGTASPTCSLDVSNTLRAISGEQVAPTAGVGLEMFYASGVAMDPQGIIIAFDRDAAEYRDVRIGNSVVFTAESNILLQSAQSSCIQISGSDVSDICLNTSGNVHQLVLETGGNVGIGTTTPTARLDVVNDVAGFDVDGHLAIQNDNSPVAGDEYAGIGFSVHSNVGDGNIKNYFGVVSAPAATHGQGDFVFLADNASDNNPVVSGEEVMRITSAGHVGIGVTAPTNPLHVASTSSVGVFEMIGGAVTAGSNLVFRKSRGTVPGATTIVADGDDVGALFFYAADGDSLALAGRIQCSVDGTPGDGDMPGRLTFSTTPDGSDTTVERMRIDAAGEVTIADLAGGGTLDLQTDNNGVISVVPSDQRLKNKVSDFASGDALAAVNNLQPHYFTWKDSGKYGARTEIGLFSQEVADVVPEAAPSHPKYDNSGIAALDENGDPDFHHGLQHGALIGLLVQSVKDLKSENDDLRARLDAGGL